MKRFYKEANVVPIDGEFLVQLDGRDVKTPANTRQIVPSAKLAEALADEWRAQGEKLDPKTMPMRDLADYAIDQVGKNSDDVVAKLLAYAETDTLSYRAEPQDPLFLKQQVSWEPILSAVESRMGVQFERVSGVIHQQLREPTRKRLTQHLSELDKFTLASLEMLASLAASLSVAFEAIESGTDAEKLFAAANLEQDTQAEEWGWDAEAKELRDARLASFNLAANFCALARAD